LFDWHRGVYTKVVVEEVSRLLHEDIFVVVLIK
jgi:hypothetical protein